MADSTTSAPRGKSWRREREGRERRLKERRAENVSMSGGPDPAGPAAPAGSRASSTGSSTSSRGKERAGGGDRRPSQGRDSAETEAQLKAGDDRAKQEGEQRKLREEEKRIEEKEEEKQRLVKEEEEKKAAELEQQQLQEELGHLNSYIDELEERMRIKAELREANSAATNERQEICFSALDSSLKKNTAFVRKLKSFTESQKESIIRDMLTLNLTKYVSEVAAALVEVKLKITDVPAVVEVCSALHCRYADFSPQMMEIWHKVLALRKDEKVSNPSKLRVDLRLYADLVSVCVLPRREALPLLGQALQVLVAQDRADHANISVLLSFCRHSGEEYAGLTPRRVRQLAERHNRVLPNASLLTPEKQKNVRQLFKDYYASVAKHLVGEHQALLNVQRSNRHALQTKGELSAERQERLQQAESSYRKLLASTEQLAELVDEPLPELPEDAEQRAEQRLLEAAEEEGVIGDQQLVWEDDDQRQFYTSLSDLRASIPSILYSDSQVAATPPVEEQAPEDMGDLPEDEAANDEHLREPEEEPEPETASSSSNRMLLEAYLTSLPGRVSRSLIDSAAVEFCMSLNTKSNRKKLVRALFNVPRTRLDLLPFYARLVATLHPCMPDVATELAMMLKADFKYHVRKKDQINIETKLKVMRFIGELVKFGMYGRNEALWCVRMLLNDFTHHHVEMACALLETCGRFLYRTAETHVRTKVYLEQLMRKKAAMAFDSRYVTMIDNMYYTVLPPEGAALCVQKVRPPLHNYMRKLIYQDLAKNTTEKVLRQLRKLDWKDADTASYCIKCLSSVWRIKYYHIRCLASLVAGLAQYQEEVGPRVVDNTLEDVRLGMEINEVRFNQRRISVVRYLGELYNYRLLDTGVVFKVLYSLISFGVSLDPEVPSPLDPPGSELRLRLVCVLLDTCGRYFSSGSAKRQLDHYIVYLQRYFWARKAAAAAAAVVAEEAGAEPFPVRLEYMYRDTLSALRPRATLHSSREAAVAAAEKLDDELRRRLAELVPAAAPDRATGAGDAELPVIAEEPPAGAVGEDGDFDEPEEESLSQQLTPPDGDEQDEADERDEVAPRGTQDDVEDELTDELGASDVDAAASDATDALAPQRIACPEDDDFLAALDQMVSESIMERSREAVKPQFELSAPVSTGGPVRKTYGDLTAERTEADRPAPSTVTFLLLMRRGNKQQHRSLAVPDDSELAVSLRSHEEAERQERERVKQLTLNINERQEEEEMQELNSAPARPLNPNRDRRPKYQHAKGVPDADLIFGPKRSNLR
ncbi:Regulator of nonsense transcripts 2 [Amphibalanus amphitrite]|uniref:Regulator of nonsense transcripts 2 n=1 Tax=Amphibalanus amphitrite TaxID=1232801 RepID=A0A6A4WWV6_AMPAM|nr:Regulator of nonsense transcripts 2 [Amphibalanus amphitrite]